MDINQSEMTKKSQKELTRQTGRGECADRQDHEAQYTFVLLRGLCRGAYHWAGFDQKLQLQFVNSNIIALDLPGNGVRHNEISPTSIAAMVKEYRKQLKNELSNSELKPIVIIAVSLGGMVALEWALEFPEEVQQTWIINSSMAGLSPFWKRIKPVSLFKLLIAAIKGGQQFEQQVVAITTSSLKERDQVSSQWYQFQRKHPMSWFNAFRQIWAAAKYSWNALKRMKAPNRLPRLCVLVGAQDQLVDPDCSKQLADRFQAPLFTHPTAGHDLTLDDPDWVIQHITHGIKLMNGGAEFQNPGTALFSGYDRPAPNPDLR